MDVIKTSSRIHPLVAGAAVSVTLVSLIGVAAITGLLPNSHGTAAPDATLQPIASATMASSATATADTQAAPENTTNPAPAAQHRSNASHAAQTHNPQPRALHNSEPGTVTQAQQICESCGRVESVRAIQQAAKPSGLGVVAGAVLGGVLGNQVGGGNGRALATVAGAVGGGYAGNEVEKRTRSTTAYEVRVRMEDGSSRIFPYSAQPAWNAGDRVKVVDGSLTARG